MNSGWPTGAIAVALTVGVGIGVWWTSGEAPGGAPASALVDRQPRPEGPPRVDGNALEATLQTANQARAQLEARVATLEARVDALGAASGSPDDGRSSATTAREAESGPTGWFDDEGLRSAEIPPEAIAALRAEVSAYEMDRLLLRDQAVREGWNGTPRYREELEASTSGVRSELGEDRFDWMLYASGRPNRVLVADVLGESPAAEAGLLPGDVLRSYDSLPLYSPRDLQGRIAEGEVGESVALVVDRGGDRVELYVPRGPLGIRLDARRVAPEAPIE